VGYAKQTTNRLGSASLADGRLAQEAKE